jgi:Aminotransferase class-III/Transmembrane secretion effector
VAEPAPLTRATYAGWHGAAPMGKWFDRAEAGACIVEGRGARVRDAAGRWYLDAKAGLWNVTLGYDHPTLVAAIERQLRTLPAGCFVRGERPPRVSVEFANALAARLPAGVRRIRLGTTGSQMTEAAVLLSRFARVAEGTPRRKEVVALRDRLLAIAGFVSLLDGIVEVALPVFVRFDVGGGAGLYGAVVTGFGVGSLAGTLVLGSLRGRVPLRPVALLAALGWGAATVAIGLTGDKAGLLAAAVVVGVCWGPFGAATLTAIQEASAPGALPRTMNAWATVQTGAMPVGLAIGGPLVAATGPRAAIVGAGAAAAAVSAVSLAAVRRPRRR